MEPNIEAINKKIDAMTSICANGKEEIRALVGEIIGKTLIEPMPPLRTAQVWRNGLGAKLAIFRHWDDDNWVSVWTPDDRLKGADARMHASGSFYGNEAAIRKQLQLHGLELIGTAELTVKPL